jgi:hypothetical protein
MLPRCPGPQGACAPAHAVGYWLSLRSLGEIPLPKRIAPTSFIRANAAYERWLGAQLHLVRRDAGWLGHAARRMAEVVEEDFEAWQTYRAGRE